MQAIHVIRRPLITEKSTFQAERDNRYAFEVDGSARKGDIKAAVEQLYNVKVAKVATQTRKGKSVRTKVGYVQKPSWKRALVTLAGDDKIELF
jgi:large subunit ribosomal protein L23